jgi:glycerol-3-phosphate O-acyltransferase 1/2
LKGLRSVSSYSSLYGLDIVVSEDKRQTIEKLAEHVVYDAFNSTALMATHLVAFLLLTKHRKGATLHQLTQNLNWMREECSRRKRDVGVNVDSLDAIRYACGLLGKDLVSVEKMSMAWSSSTSRTDGENNNVKIVFLKPSVKLPHVLELQYYANSCISIFQLDSVVG